MPGKKKVLVIEDDTMMADIYSLKIAESGYEVSTARDGETGWDLLVGDPPDVLILDLMLPRISGLDFLARLRAHDDRKIAAIPVIVVTNLNEHSYSDDLRRHDVSAYFMKSNVNFSQILEKIEELIGKG